MLKVDLSDVRKLTKRADKFLGDVDADMRDVVEDAAADLRANDPYTNRTGFLRTSTQGEMQRFDGNEIEATMAMGMPYASFVIAKGWSDWQDEVEDAERRMDNVLSAIANKITRA